MVVYQNGFIPIYQSLDELVLSYPTDVSQVPDIFINVLKHSKMGITKAKRLGYVRLKASDLTSKGNAVCDLLKGDIFGEGLDDGQIAGFIQYK